MGPAGKRSACRPASPAPHLGPFHQPHPEIFVAAGFSLRTLKGAATLQLTFRARDAFDTRVALAGEIEGLGERLEDCFDNVMRLVAAQYIDVQIAARLVGETLQEFFHQADTKTTGRDACATLSTAER